jgi:hypothetical protein
MKTYEKGYSLDGTDNYHIDLKEKILTNGEKVIWIDSSHDDESEGENVNK